MNKAQLYNYIGSMVNDIRVNDSKIHKMHLDGKISYSEYQGEGGFYYTHITKVKLGKSAKMEMKKAELESIYNELRAYIVVQINVLYKF